MEIVILLEKRRGYVEDFLELIDGCRFASIGLLRKKFPNTTANNTIHKLIFKINQSIKSLYPNIEVFTFNMRHENQKFLRGYEVSKNFRFKNTKYHNIIILEDDNKNTKDSV